MKRRSLGEAENERRPNAVLASFSAAQNGLALPAGDDGVPIAVGKAAILQAIRSLLDGETKVTTVIMPTRRKSA